jgi:peptide/nickel transport system ATP-binding protein
MRQRAMIAMALGCEPDILIADEPTTALDVTTQAEILKLIRDIQSKYGMAVMFITRDMGVVAEIADDVFVMYRGRVVEHGAAKQIFHAPRHAYTRKLIDASLGLENAPARPPRSREGLSPVIAARDLSLHFPPQTSWFKRREKGVQAVDEVSFELWPGEILGIVGESGSGKTTLGRIVMGRHTPQQGSAIYTDESGVGRDLADPTSFRDGQVYREIRMIFQDPYSSLNPRMTVEQIIAEPLVVAKLAKGGDLHDRVAALLERVGLPSDIMDR